MNIHKLGCSDLNVSAIGIGLAALGRPGYINLGHAEDLERDYDAAIMQKRAHCVLDAAYGGGVRYFDAARSYGRAEQFLGSWLTSRFPEPGSVSVGSKWGYTYTANWQVEAEAHEVKEHSLPVLERQYKESRSNLGAFLDLYQIHSATLESGVLENGDVLKELARLKSEGLLIGFSVSGPQQAQVIERALDLEVDGLRLFDSLQVTWNILERSTTQVIKEAHEMGVGIIVKEALANGRLTDKNAAPDDVDKLVILKEEAQRLSTTIDGLALAAVLAQPWADVVLSGAARVEHLESNLKAVDVAYDGEAEDRFFGLVETPQEYWDIRSALVWN